nr:MarR family transcriptional regulator [Cohnella sp. CFH 77786]
MENQVCFALYSLAKEVTKLYHPHLKKLGLTYTQYIALIALWEKDRISVKELGARLFLDSGTLTPLLKKLEKMGLLKRERDKRDERSLVIALTPEGTALREKAKDIPERLFCDTGVTASEAELLRRVVQDSMSKMRGSVQVPDNK